MSSLHNNDYNEYSDDEISSTYNSDEELDYFEFQRLEKYSKVSHFTLEDYLKCEKTFKALYNDYENRFYNEVYDDMERLFYQQQELQENNGLSFLENASGKNDIANLVYELVKHHIVPQFDTTIFKKDPDLAQPLLNEIDAIKKNEKVMKNLKYSESMKHASKENKWNTSVSTEKKVLPSMKSQIKNNEKTNNVIFKEQIKMNKEEENRLAREKGIYNGGVFGKNGEKPKNRFLGK